MRATRGLFHAHIGRATRAHTPVPSMPLSAIAALALALVVGACASGGGASPQAGPAAAAHSKSSSAIFLHPDGMGANTWAAIRLKEVGPDGRLAWDRLPHASAYVGPMIDSVTASSNGGGTSHAWGVRAMSGSFGLVNGQRLQSASGADAPLMLEAKRAGKAIGLVNTASITDAGTGTQIGAVANRRDHAEIASQIMAARPDVVLGGGEQYFLPVGVQGRHGVGVRTDGRNLIEDARAQGYRVVFTREEFNRALSAPGKLLGLFAAENTFGEGGEEAIAATGKPLFVATAPRYDEMVAGALQLLSSAPNGFYLMAEEEATDNLGGDNNASGVLDAGAGADRAIATAMKLAQSRSDVTIVVASDSDCGGLQPTGDDVEVGKPLPARLENGSPLDGAGGTGTVPFLAAPDRTGKRLPFAISWAADGDMTGGGVVRAMGPGAGVLTGTSDSTDVFRALHAGLFGAPRAQSPR